MTDEMTMARGTTIMYRYLCLCLWFVVRGSWFVVCGYVLFCHCTYNNILYCTGGVCCVLCVRLTVDYLLGGG